MPIRINLKELFSSDSQGVTVDKLNFNFNKLLELGVGLEGDQGIQGPQGAAGPQGPSGPRGNRGTYWFVGTGNPNGVTLPDLQDDDFFLDTNNSEIWQYDSASNNWILLVDFGNIINNYLTAFGSTFIRGIGETSPDDNRFVVFPNRGNDSIAQTSDSLGGSSDNDILFLNNFNEKAGVVTIDNFPSNPNDLYNAIQKIYVDAISGVPGRYHLELGSLFSDTNGPSTNLLSELKHNTKFRHVVDDLGGISNFPSSNDYVYISRASMSKTEIQPISELDFNSMFEFITAKYNNEGTSAVSRELTVRIGSAEALGEYWSESRVDGISFNLSTGSVEGDADIGIVRRLSSNNQSRDDQNYFALGYGAGIAGIMLTGDVYQEGGKIEQLGADGAITIDQITNQFLVLGISNPTGYFHNLAIASFGNRLYTAEGRSPDLDQNPVPFGTPQSLNDPDLKGAFYSWNIQEGKVTPNTYSLGTGLTGLGTVSASVDNSFITGSGICDMVVDGEYAYTVHNQINSVLSEVSGGVSLPDYRQTNLQIIDLGNNGNRVRRVNSDLTFLGSNLQALDAAWRIDTFGNYLVVGTNYLRTFGNINGPGNTILQNGKLVLVDRSDLQNPVEFTTGVLDLRRTVTTSNDTKRHVMDMRVYDKYIITIELELVEVTNLSAPFDPPNSAQGGHQIQVNLYEILDGPSIVWRGTQLLESDSTPVTVGNFSQLPKVGAVETDGQYIYASFKDKVYVIEFDTVYTFRSPFSPPGANTMGIHHTFDFTSRLGGACFDIKVAGNSIYLLNGDDYIGVGLDQPYRYDNTYLTKINISNPGSLYNEWERNLSNGGTRFEIVGNKAYISSQTHPPAGSDQYDHGIETIELDGIVSDHANLSNLRSDKVKVMSDIEVGNSAKVGSSLNVGQGLNVGSAADISGPLSVEEGRIQASAPSNRSKISLNDRSYNETITLSEGVSGSNTFGVLKFGPATNSSLNPSHYILTSNQNERLLFGCETGGSNFELVLHNAGSVLPSPFVSDNGLQIKSSLWVGGNAHIDTELSVNVVTGTGVALFRNTTTGKLAASTSDERLKQNIETIDGALDKVLNMRGVYFNWKEAEGFSTDDGSRQIGMVAQEVEEFLPEAVTLNGIKDYKTIRYSEMVAVLVEAVKEQQEQIESLKDEIAVLKGTSPEGY